MPIPCRLIKATIRPGDLYAVLINEEARGCSEDNSVSRFRNEFGHETCISPSIAKIAMFRDVDRDKRNAPAELLVNIDKRPVHLGGNLSTYRSLPQRSRSH